MEKKTCIPVAGFLIILGGAVTVLLGIALLIAASQGGAALAGPMGIGYIILGIVWLVLGIGIQNCKKWAALSYLIAVAITLIFGLILALSTRGGNYFGPGILGIILAAIVYDRYRKGQFV